MSKNSIKINGSKLRGLLEKNTGLTIYQIAESNGFSRNIIAQAIRQGIASPTVQMIADKCGVNTEDYIVKDPEPVEELKGQISIDDIEALKREELEVLLENAFTVVLKKVSKGALKTVFKESIGEMINSLSYRYDPITKAVTFEYDKEA